MARADSLTIPMKIRTHRFAIGETVRTFVIGLTAFLTVVDLFATQAILPTLARAYHVTPAAMGLAVNASTVGMAIAGLAVAFFSRRINRRAGILLSLAFLAVPTSLLAVAPNLSVFTALRVTQGLFMSTAFTLTLAYLAEQCSAKARRRRCCCACVRGAVKGDRVGPRMRIRQGDCFAEVGLASDVRVGEIVYGKG